MRAGALTIVAACLVVTGAAQAATGSGIARPDEPVVIQYTEPVQFADDPLNAGYATGERNQDLPQRLRGIPPQSIVAFRWEPGTSAGQGTWVQVPIQIDEREVMDLNRIYGPGFPDCSDPCYSKPPDGAEHINYTDPKTFVGGDTDRALDVDDEVALMAREAGAANDSGTAPAGVAPDSAAELKLTDPLQPNVAGYVYLFERTDPALDQAAGAADVDYHFELAGGASYTDPSGPYDPTTSDPASAPNMGHGPRPETSYVQTANYRRGFTDRWFDDELRILRGGATGEDILDRHDAQFDALDATCVRTQSTYASGEGAFVTNQTGPIRAIRDFIGANSGPHVQRQHLFYDAKETINTFLRVHPVPGVTDFFDYSAAAISPSMTYSNGLQTLGTINSGAAVDGTPDLLAPGGGSAGVSGWEALDGPQGGIVMPQSFVTNNVDPSYRLNHRDLANAPTTCNGDEHLYGASGPQGNSAFENTDEAAGGVVKNLYYKRSIFYSAPGKADGEARFAEEQSPLTLNFANPKLAAPAQGGNGGGSSGGGSGGDGGSGGSGGNQGAPRCGNVIDGTEGDDRVRATKRSDRIRGLGGNDKLDALGDHDCVNGGDGNDRVKGDEGEDRIGGGEGRDRLKGDDDDDRIAGGDDADRIKGGAGNDRIRADGDGTRDKIDCGAGEDLVLADERDKLRGCEKVR